jgi:hypothetical protein
LPRQCSNDYVVSTSIVLIAHFSELLDMTKRWFSNLNALSLGALALILGASSAVQAQNVLPITNTSTTTDDPLVFYRAYNDAVNAGRLQDAASNATRAWQAAETKWGASNPNTAGLAFNAAWSAALVDKSPERLDAAKRAVELAPTATASYSPEEARFLLAYAEYFSVETKDRPAEAPKLAAAAQAVENTWGDYLIVNALINAASMSAGPRRGRSTISIAERALVAIDRLAPNDGNFRALALLARAQGRLSANIDQEEAVADLIQARVAYGPMRAVDDKTWGSLAAWEMASRSVVASLNNFQQTTGSRL